MRSVKRLVHGELLLELLLTLSPAAEDDQADYYHSSNYSQNDSSNQRVRHGTVAAGRFFSIDGKTGPISVSGDRRFLALPAVTLSRVPALDPVAKITELY